MNMPGKMKAAILSELKKPLIIDEVLLPEKLEAGQTLVKVHFSGICGSQLGEIDGKKGDDPYLPHLQGHEGSGEVLEIGAGVRYVKPGDRVVMHWKKGFGIDALPPVYSWKGKKLNAGFVTTFNEYAIVSENRLTPIPDDFDMRTAALFGCAVTTGLGTMMNNANLKIGESVVVFGAGGVGLNIIQAAALTSAYPVIAVDLLENKLEMARKFGATHILCNREKDCEGEILNILNPEKGADVVVDNTGNTKIMETAYKLTKAQGRTILVGVPKKTDDISIHSLPLHFGKSITGSFGGETMPSIDIPRYIKLHKAGKLNLDGLITDTFRLEQINEAMDKMRKGEIAGRCIIEMD